MRMSELPPGFTPEPPMPRLPIDKGTWYRNETSDQAYRRCACELFGVYLSARGWRKICKPGEELFLHPLRPGCDRVTREYFSKGHQGTMRTWLSKAQGFGYKVCLLPDETPREPFEVSEMYGLEVNDQMRLSRDRTIRAVARRGNWESNNNKAVEHSRADEIVRIL